MQENAVSQVSGQNITVDFGSSDVRILNYPGPPVVINALENIAKIWGQVTVPEGFKGDPLNIKITYGDAVDGAKRTINSPVNIRPAKSDEEYQNSIRNNLLSEFRYYQAWRSTTSSCREDTGRKRLRRWDYCRRMRSRQCVRT